MNPRRLLLSAVLALVGCGSLLDGSKQNNWYYQGTRYADEAAARAECSGGQTFVPPQ
jgi:hypothetical protein